MSLLKCFGVSLPVAVALISGCRTRSFNAQASNLLLDGPIRWESCVFPDIPANALPPGVAVDCFVFKVPLDWKQPSGQKIDYLVRWVHAVAPHEVTSQVWFSAGGPGSRGNRAAFSYAAEVAANPTREFFIPDHRGVGRSTKLGCGLPQDVLTPTRLTQNDFAKCVTKVKEQWGHQLQFFDVTSAARDAIEVSRLIRNAKANFFFEGLSYGTYLTNRIAQLSPDEASGWIMGGYSPGVWIANDAKNARLAATAVLNSLCAGNTICSQKLGETPEKALLTGVEGLKSGRCNLGSASQAKALIKFLGEFTQSEGPVLGVFPVIAYRLARCNSKDVAFLNTVVTMATPPGLPPTTGTIPDLSQIDVGKIPEDTKMEGWFLQQYILASELFHSRPMPPHDALLAELSAEPFFLGDMSQADFLTSFPQYDTSFVNGTYADTKKPVLILNGSRDKDTPAALIVPAAQHYNSPNQHVLVVPWATHGVWQSGPKLLNGTPCSAALREAFIANPEGSLDTTCLKNAGSLPPIPPLNTPLPSEFGLSDSFWGD
jgi:pimeloyl-ACP methyl ester carboxylesterase